MVLEGKSSQEYPVNARISQGSILGPTFSILHTDDILIMSSVVSLSILMIPFSTLYKCDQATELWQQRVGIPNLNLTDKTLDLASWWLVDFNSEKKSVRFV